MPLTPKQSAFIIEYLKDFNAAAAAARAGYKGSPSALANTGRNNLANPEVQRRVNQALEEWAMSSEEVLYRLSRHARGTMSNFVTESPSGEVKIDLLKALRSGAMEQVRYLVFDERRDKVDRSSRRVEVSLYDALTALNQLAKSHTLPGAALHESASQDSSTPQQEQPMSHEEFYRWIVEGAARVKEWLLDEFGDMETGIIAHSKEIFGDDFEPTPRFLEMAYEYFKDLPKSPRPLNKSTS